MRNAFWVNNYNFTRYVKLYLIGKYNFTFSEILYFVYICIFIAYENTYTQPEKGAQLKGTGDVRPLLS